MSMEFLMATGIGALTAAGLYLIFLRRTFPDREWHVTLDNYRAFLETGADDVALAVPMDDETATRSRDEAAQ